MGIGYATSRRTERWLSILSFVLVGIAVLPPYTQHLSEIGHRGEPNRHFALFATTLDGVLLRADGRPSWQRIWRAPVRPQDAGDVNPIWSLAAAADGHTLYAGAYNGAVWRSNDGGHHWRRTRGSLPADYDSIDAFAVSPTDANVAYAGALDGLFETTDGGVQWHKLSAGQDVLTVLGGDISVITIDSRHPLSIWAGRSGEDGVGGLYHSNNGGRTWVRVRTRTGLPALTSINGITIVPTTGIIFVVSSNIVYRSRDGGAHWSRLTRGLPAPGVNLYLSFPPVLAVSPRSPNRVYVGLAADTPRYDFGLYVTEDDGTTWSRSKGGLKPGEAATQVVADPMDRMTAYIGTTNRVLRTTDGGKSWKPWQNATLSGALAGGFQIYYMVGMQVNDIG